MSVTVDERVVKMEFDNANFEKNVSTSLSTLDRLKQSLNLEGAVRNLNNLTTAGKNFTLDGMTTAVESVGEKFNAMEIIATGALLRIGSQAVSAGERLIKSLSLDQISAGWEKFGEKTTSVATLVSQGYGLEEVNEQLNRLNWFTDETSYNFVDMTSNIAKFTAAGQKLPESVTAMEGIANWAALSGQNASTASRAMYQLSQAMGSGFMKKEDYKSIQNASMDTQEFRQKCLDAGEALGRLKKNADGTYTSIAKEGKSATFGINQFADNLTESLWLNSDVMMKVFNDYSSAVDIIYDVADAMDLTASQVIEAKEALDQGDEAFNNYAESLDLTATQTAKLKESASQIDDFGIKAFRSAQEARTFADVIDSVKDAVSTGWMNIFEEMIGSYDEAKTLWTGLANYLYDVFTAPTYAILDVVTEWRALMGREELLGGFSELASAAELLAGILGDAFSGIFDPFTGTDLALATRSFKQFATALGDMLGTVNDYETTLTPLGQDIQNTFSGVFAVVDIVWTTIKAIAGGVVTVAKSLEPIAMAIMDSLGSLGEWVTNLDKTLKDTNAISDAVQYVANNIAAAITYVTPYILGVKDAFADLYSWAAKKFEAVGITNFGDAIDKLKEKFQNFEPVLDKFKEAVGGAFDWLASHISFDALGAAFSNFGTILSTVYTIVVRVGKKIGEVLSGIFDAFTQKGNAAMGVATDVGVLGILYSISNFLNSKAKIISDLKGLAGNITDILEGVEKTLEAYQTNLKADALLKIAEAVGVLAASLWLMSTIDSDSIAAPLTAVSVLLGEVTAAFVVLNKLTQSSGGDSGGGMLGPLKGIINGIQSIGQSAEIMSQATTLVMLAGAVAVLTVAVKNLSDLDLEQLATGLLGVTILLGELIATTKLLKGDEFVSGASGMILMAAAVRVLVESVKSLADMDFETMLQGLAGVMSLLLGMAAFTKNSGDPEHMISIGVGLIAMAAAMKILVTVVKDFGSMDFNTLEQGMVAFGVALAAITVSMRYMPSGAGMIATGIGLIAVAAAMKVVASAVADFGGMSVDQVTQGLVGLAVALTLMSVALNVCEGTLAGSAALLIAAGAIALLVPSIAALGSLSVDTIVQGLTTIAVAIAGLLVAAVGAEAVAPGLLVLSGALLAISASAAILGVAFIAIGAGLTSISIGITALAGSAAVGSTAIVAAVTAIITGLIGMIPAIAASIVEGIVTITTLIAQNAPVIVSSILIVATQVLSGLMTLIPQVVNLITMVVLEILQYIQTVAPEIVETVVTVLEAVLDGINEIVPEIVETIYDTIIDILDVIQEKIPEVIQKGVEIIEALIDGITQAIPELVDHGMKAIIDLINGLADAIRDNTDSMIEATNNLMDAIIEAIGKYLSNFFDKGGEIVQKVIDGIGDVADDVIEAGYNIVTGLINGIESGIGEIYTTVKNLGSGMLQKLKDSLQEKSPSKATEQMGEYYDEGLEKGIQNGKKDVLDAAEDLGDATLEAVEEPLSETAVAVNDFVKDYEKNLNTLARTIPVEKTTKTYNSFDEVMTDLSDIVGAFNNQYGELISDMTDGADTTEIARATVFKFGTELAFADEQTVTLGKTTEEQTKQIQERYESVYKAVRQFNDELTSTVENQMDVFEGFSYDTEDVVAPEKILSNMKSWNDATENWANDITDLADRGLNQGMLQKLANMGPEGQKYIESFVQMTDEQLQQFNTLWANSSSIAETAATSVTASLIHSGSMIDLGLAQGIQENGQVPINEMVVVSQGVASAPDDVLDMHSPSRVMYDKGYYVDQGLADGIRDYQSLPSIEMEATCNSIISKIDAALPSQKLIDIGRNICAGIAAGIRTNSSLAISAAEELADSVESSFRSVLDIESPSKVFANLGRYIDIGLSQGINKNAVYAVDSINTMGEQAVETMRLSVANLQALMDDEIDFNPMITPQLDLTNLKDNLGSVNGLFTDESLAVAAEGQNGATLGNGTTFSFVQNNYSPKALSRAEIYRQTKNQFTRMKGLVSGV